MTDFTPPTFLSPVADASRRYQGLTYALRPGYRPRLLDLTVPEADGPVPLVVWIHGGAWLEGDRRYTPPTIPAELLFGSLLEAGLAVATIDYRHSQEARFPAQHHDVVAAIRYLRTFAGELGLDAARFGVMGESAGGHLAALAALAGPELAGVEGVGEGDHSVQAVVDWYGVADMITVQEHPLEMPPGWPDPYESLFRGDDELAGQASPINHITADAPPFLLVHGTVDQVVPYSQSVAFDKALREQGVDVTLSTIEDANHIFLGVADVQPIVAESVAFLARHLTGRP
ncbi:alpha/beta hydrolase fold domain-containing protein [Nonomuraea sp. NPDC050556]|uniref:alpha/beta hydrolase fold domain-containing protein n=1 Tax=Nonomuraea sp. NPDC050556 TaxID=3364369 RepID=UPI0037AD9CFF